MLRAFFCWIIHYLICCANSFIPLFFYLIALSLFLKHPFNFSEQYQEGVACSLQCNQQTMKISSSVWLQMNQWKWLQLRHRGSQERFLPERPEEANFNLENEWTRKKTWVSEKVFVWKTRESQLNQWKSADKEEPAGLREQFGVRDPQDSQNGFAFEGKEVLITMDGELPEAKWKHPISPLRKD